MRFIVVISGPSIEFNSEGKPIMKECLLFRMEKALAIWQEMTPHHDDIFIITSGWDGDGTRGLSSSTVMKNYLVEHGVPTYRVFEDRRASSTRENALNCCALMIKCAKDGVLQMRDTSSDDSPYQYVGPIRDICLVTSEFHIKRSAFLFEHCIKQAPELSQAQRHYSPSKNGIDGDRLAAFLKIEKRASESLGLRD